MRTQRKVNLSDPMQRALLVQEIMSATGPHHVEISPARLKASEKQHGYYRAVLVPTAKLWLNETQGGDEWGDDFDEESTHNWLKTFLRGKPVVNRKTGEVVGMAASSHATYSMKDMAEFITDVMDLFDRNEVKYQKPDKDYRQRLAKMAGGK